MKDYPAIDFFAQCRKKFGESIERNFLTEV